MNNTILAHCLCGYVTIPVANLEFCAEGQTRDEDFLLFPSLPFLSPPYPPSHTFSTPLSFCSFHFPFPSFSSSPAAKRSPNPAKVSGKSCKFSQRDPRYFCDILSQETWQLLQTKPCRQKRHSLREDEGGAITHSDLGPPVVSAVDMVC